jgi:hypothetical protein
VSKKPEKPAKKPRAKKPEKPGKETAPKARKGQGDSGEGAPPPPPPPPPPQAPASRDDAEGWMDGKRALDHLRHLLAGCPKTKDNPALAFVLIAGTKGVATDDLLYQQVDFEAPVSETVLKVTRASVQSFERLLDGEIKSAAEVEATVLVTWRGLVAKIRRTGSDEEHTVLLDKHYGGPAAEYMALDAPAFVPDAHVTLDLELLRDALVWKGKGTLHLFVSPEARQLWMQIYEGDRMVARSVLTYAGSTLGIREPTLPGVNTSPRRPATAPEGEAGARPASVPVTVHQLPSGTGWCRVECNRSAAWDRLAAGEISDLAPYSIDEAQGFVVWGPYPRGIARVAYILKRLKALNLDPRLVACDAPDLMARALGAGEPVAPESRQLGDGTVDAEFEDAPPALGDGGGRIGLEVVPAFPAPPRDEPVSIIVPAAIWDDELADAQTGALRLLDRTPSVEWRVDGETLVSRSLDAEEARTLGGLLASWGYRAAEVRRETYGDDAVTVWVVGRQGETGGAAL